MSEPIVRISFVFRSYFVRVQIVFRSLKCLYQIEITGIECGLKSGLETNEMNPDAKNPSKRLNVDLKITGMGVVGDTIRDRIRDGFGSKSWNTWKDLMLILIFRTCMSR